MNDNEHMDHVKVLINSVRDRTKQLCKDYPKYKDTITSIFKITEDVAIHLTHPVNTENLYYEENGLIHGGVHGVLYLEGHHPSDKDRCYVSRYEKGGAEEYTISVSPVMVHVANSMVLCTDPNIEISVITDIGIVDKIKSAIIDVYKTLLLYHRGHLSQTVAS
jgi:hypothetical protein|nr:MAG TPA: hypothetical protein [Caudoviricetes sp.]